MYKYTGHNNAEENSATCFRCCLVTFIAWRFVEAKNPTNRIRRFYLIEGY